MRKLSPPFHPGRLSNKYAHNADVEPTHHDPFDDDAAPEDEYESDSSTSTPRGDQIQNLEDYDNKLVRGPLRTWERERPERLAGQIFSELTTTTFDGRMDTKQEWPETTPTDPSQMDKDQLLQLVMSLNTQIRDQHLQLDQIRNIQRHELTNRPQGLSHGNLVNDMRDLRTQILRWTETHSRYEGGISAPKNVKQFRHIVSDPDTYIKDEVYRSWLIQARLWDLLQRHIFEDDKNGDWKYYGYIWTGGRAKQTFLKKAVTKDNERVDRDMRPLDAVLRPPGNSLSEAFASSYPRLILELGTADELAWKTYLDWRASTTTFLPHQERR